MTNTRTFTSVFSRLLCFLITLTLAVTLSSRTARAHDVRGEIVFLDVGESAIGVELHIPVTQLRAAAPELTISNDNRVRAYVATHLHAFEIAEERRPFTTTIASSRVTHVDDGDVVIVKGTLSAPEGGSARSFELRDDVILERVLTHSVYVFLRRDVRAGELLEEGQSPTLLGQMHYQQRSLLVDRSAGTPLGIVHHTLSLGMRHIQDGADHILFLLMLLLTAPLAAAANAPNKKRWQAHKTVREAARHTAKVVTAFTLGHSLTLIVVVFFHLTLASRLSSFVESTIAISILVTAIHALRPISIFAGREAFVAGAFGLVHGLAFASALAAFDVDRTTLALSLLGFNLGVEAMQIVIVLVTVPLLTVLSRGPSYGIVRTLVASFAGIAACGFLAERIFGIHAPTTAVVTAIAHRGAWLALGLAVMTAADVFLRRPRQQQQQQQQQTTSSGVS